MRGLPPGHPPARGHRLNLVFHACLGSAMALAVVDVGLVVVVQHFLPGTLRDYVESLHGPLTSWVGFLGTGAAVLDRFVRI